MQVFWCEARHGAAGTRCLAKPLPVAALLPARVPGLQGVATVSMDMDTQGVPFDSLDGGPRDPGVAMVDEDDSADSGGSVVAMDEEEDPMEDETPPRKLVRRESSAVLHDDVFAAAHTGDCQAVRAFLADPRGDVNMRDRHAAVLARTVLPTSWADPPVHPNANPPGQAP